MTNVSTSIVASLFVHDRSMTNVSTSIVVSLFLHEHQYRRLTISPYPHVPNFMLYS